MTFLRFIHLFAFTFWYGTVLYFTLQAVILFKSFPRETAGMFQNQLFPTYYLISYICGTLLVVLYPILHPMKNWGPHDGMKLTLLFLMLVFSLAQGLWAGPKVSQLRLQRQAAEQAKDPVKTAALSKEFGKAHGVSSLLNLLVIFSGLVYLSYLAKAPQAPSDLLKGLF